MNSKINLKIDTPAIYRIKVQGKLDPSYSGLLHDMQITHEKDKFESKALLVGKIEDQAALSGILNSLYELHLPVLSVECLQQL